jgi:hypothetical protein
MRMVAVACIVCALLSFESRSRPYVCRTWLFLCLGARDLEAARGELAALSLELDTAKATIKSNTEIIQYQSKTLTEVRTRAVPSENGHEDRHPSRLHCASITSSSAPLTRCTLP